MTDIKFIIDEKAINQINELIALGWEFTLHYGDNSYCAKLKGLSWEADFTRKKENGLWDNHESGYSIHASEAINKAYNNIKTGVKYKIPTK